MSASVALILGLILGFGGTVVSLILITPDKKRAKLNSFLRFVHDLFNFKFLFIEKVLQFLYILLTLSTIGYGFFLLFSVQRSWGYYGSYSSSMAGQGLLIMILGHIVIRIVYELWMMLVLLVKNTIQINNKLKNQNEGGAKSVFDAQPEFLAKPEENEAE